MSKEEVATKFLGICLDYSLDCLCLSQEACVKKLLDKFKINNYKPCDTSLAQHIQILKKGRHFMVLIMNSLVLYSIYPQ